MDRLVLEAETGPELQLASGAQAFPRGFVQDLHCVVTFAESTEGVSPLAEGVANLPTRATAVVMTRVVVVVMAAVHGALNDPTEDTAKNTAEEGLTRGGGLGGSGLGGVDDVEVGVLLSLEHGLSTGEAGEIKAGHVDGCFDDELTGLTREAVVIEGSGLSVAGDGEEGGTGEGSGGDASEALTEKSEGSHGRSV